MRLIDADALMSQAFSTRQGYDAVLVDDIVNAPTVDAEPVKHARWIKCCNLMGEYFKCSECGYKAEVPTCMGEPIFTYCPICDSKMDSKDGETK